MLSSPRASRRRWFWGALVALLLLPLPALQAQGTLSQQVLQLLSRVNSWIGTNTFYDLVIPCTTIPSSTSARVYADGSCNLYFNGGLIAGAGGGVTPHNLLSTTHPDTVVASPTAGAVVVGNATPKWASLPAAVGYLKSTGAATTFSTDGAAFTSLPAGVLTGALPAISGASLISLNASNLGSGTVPLGRLSGITNTQIDAAAAIAYSKLSLANSILNTDINATAAIAYTKLALTNAIVAGDLTAGSVTMAKINQAGATAGQVIAWSGTAWAPTTATTATVSSVGLALPAIFTVAGTPVTTTGTLSATLASQTQNFFWAAPDGANGAPVFRAVVNADLPLSGVAAGTYPSVTVNTRGIVTGATASVNLATVGAATILPRANGGTGLATATDDTTMVGSGTAWVATTLPTCTRLWSYDQATNLFTCGTNAGFGTLTASTPFTVTAAWNNALVTFNQHAITVTDSASTFASTLADWTVGGVSEFKVRKDGSFTLGGSKVYSAGTPTIGSGFGTSPSIVGKDAAFRVTQGNPVGATGVVTFSANSTWTNAPVCTGVDETTTGGNPLKLTATTAQVTIANGGGTMVAADVIAVHCTGY